MSGPTAPTGEKSERKAEAAPITETTSAGPVEQLAAFGGIGGRLPLTVPQLSYLNPARVTSLQRAAGNRAVFDMLQRAPVAKKAAPRSPPAGRPVLPMEVSGELPEIIESVPSLLRELSDARHRRQKIRGTNRVDALTDEEEQWRASISAATLIGRDAIYRFAGDGTLMEVESNLIAPINPSQPDEIPPPKFPLPQRSAVIVAEPASGRKWQVFLQESGRLDLQPMLSDLSLPSGMAGGQVIVIIYAPGSLASEEGGPQPGFKAKVDTAKGQANEGEDKGTARETPGWATKQYDDLMKLLKKQKPGGAGEEGGKGTGRKGEGRGGGGRGAGIGTGVSGTGIGAAQAPGGKGRGGDRPVPDPNKPDKVVLWISRAGPMLNVWKGGSAEAIPLPQGEHPDATMRRIEAASARQQSTGKRLADGATETGFEGGQGGQQPTPEELKEAQATTATSMAYPSSLKMHGGSGAEVSPLGWGTTVTGARHNFDMMLDRDAITFGAVAQVAAADERYSFRWQIVDVSNVTPAAKQERESAAAFGRKTRGAVADASKTPGSVHTVGQWEGTTAAIQQAAEGAADDLSDKPDIGLMDLPTGQWAWKAPLLAIEGLSATWDIGKAVVGAFFRKLTKPWNRQELKFGKPGEYVVRCLANPIGTRTGRATSVSTFPVRVLDMDERAMEVNREEVREIAAQKRELALKQQLLAQDEEDPLKRAAVEQAVQRIAAAERAYSRTTTQKLSEEAVSLDDEIAALEQMVKNVKPKKGHEKEKPTKDRLDGLSGTQYLAGLRVEEQEGLYSWWQWENRAQDLKKARTARKKQAATAVDWGKGLKSTTEVRPRVTFASEEDGSIVRMEMLLGQSAGRMPWPASTDEKPIWSLMDVTSPDTQERYYGTSDTRGPAGHREAIREAFVEFTKKAAYGRGTIAVDLPDIETAGGKPQVPGIMIMKPGPVELWKKRLQNIVEIAGMVAPFFKAAALARVASWGGALDAGLRLHDRVVNERLDADFELLGDIMGVLSPFIEGGGALAERMKKTTMGYVLSVTAKGGDWVNELQMPAAIFNDIERVLRDDQLGEPEKKAAIGLILGRGLRDKTVQHLGKRAAHNREHSGPWREPADPTATPWHQQVTPRPTETDTTAEGQPRKPEPEPDAPGVVLPVASTRRPAPEVKRDPGTGALARFRESIEGSTDPVAVHEAALNLVHAVGDWKGALRHAVREMPGEPGGPNSPRARAEAALVQARNAIVTDAFQRLTATHPGVFIADTGTVAFGSDIDINLKPIEQRPGFSGKPRPIKEQLTEASAGALELSRLLRETTGGETDRVLDVNVYAYLGEADITPTTAAQRGAEARLVREVGFAEQMRGQDPAAFAAFRDAISATAASAGRTPEGRRAARETLQLIKAGEAFYRRRMAERATAERSVRDLEPNAPAATVERMAREAVVAQKRSELADHAGRKPPNVAAVLRLQAEILWFEPDAYATRSAVEQAVGHSQSIRAAGRTAVHERVVGAERELAQLEAATPRDETAIKRAQLDLMHLQRQIETGAIGGEHVHADIEAIRSREGARERTAGQVLAHAAATASANLGMMESHIKQAGADGEAQVKAAAKYAGRILQAELSGLEPSSPAVQALIAAFTASRWSVFEGAAPSQLVRNMLGEFANRAGMGDQVTWQGAEAAPGKRTGEPIPVRQVAAIRDLHKVQQAFVEHMLDWARTVTTELHTVEVPGADAAPTAEAVAKGAPVPVDAPSAAPAPDAVSARTARTLDEPARQADTGAEDIEAARGRSGSQAGTPAHAGPGPDPNVWRGRAVGSDIKGPVEPSIGTGVVYDQRPADRYEHHGKPSSGTSASEILVDKTTGEKYLFKPEEGEKVVEHAEARGVEPGQYAPRAKAAEITIDRLGRQPGSPERLPGLETPGVELVQIGSRKGSLTKWVEPSAESAKPNVMSMDKYLYPQKDTTIEQANQTLIELRNDPNFIEAWNNVQALDYLINNVDRLQNWGNYIIEFTAPPPGGRFKSLKPIDSELSFTTTADRAIIREKTEMLENIPLSEALIDRLLDLGKNRHDFAAEIRPLVGDKAVDGVMQRLDELIQRGMQQRAIRGRQR